MMRNLYKAHFLMAEFFLAFFLTLALVEAGRWVPALNSALTDLGANDATLYSTLAGLAGTLLGFTITSISIILAIGPIPQLKLLRDSGQMGTVWTVFAQTIGWLAVTTVWSLIGLLLSHGGPVGSIVAVGECGLVILSGVRVYRCVWALSHIVRAALLPVPDPGIHE